MKLSEQIADIVRTVVGIEAATDEVPGQISENPIAIVYLSSWEMRMDTASNANANLQYGGNGVMRIDIHYPRADIETALKVLEPFIESIPDAIFRALDPLNTTSIIDIHHSSPVLNQSLIQGDYNGVPTIVRRFDLTGKMIAEVIRG